MKVLIAGLAGASCIGLWVLWRRRQCNAAGASATKQKSIKRHAKSGSDIKLVSFDLDGTLWSIAEVLAAASDAMYAQMTRTEIGRAVARYYPPQGFKVVMEAARAADPTLDFRRLRKAALMRCAEALKRPENIEPWAEEVVAAWYVARCDVDGFLLPGVVNVLMDLRRAGFTLAVCSNGITDLDQSARLSGLFDHVVCAAGGLKKPDESMFRRVWEAAGVAPRNHLHIGDSWDADVVGALQAGCHAAWVPRIERTPEGCIIDDRAAPSQVQQDSWQQCSRYHGRLHTLGEILELLPSARLLRVIRFMQESNGLKSVERTVRVSDDGRFENTAEHSWHLALLFLALEADLPAGLNGYKLLQMLLIHDLPEVYAGDTPLYATLQQDEQGVILDAHGPVVNQAVAQRKAQREAAAASKLFAYPPRSVGHKLADLWKEFEARETLEARYAKAMDRLVPLLQNSVSGGSDYRTCKATFASEMALLEKVTDVDPLLGRLGRILLEDARAHGWLK